jgi:hypothetical protein
LKTAVVIVHGVGDPVRGDALTKLTNGLADKLTGERVKLDGIPWVEHREGKEQASTGGSFPVTKAKLRISNPRTGKRQQVHLREVYWGDLSRVKSSLPALVYALFDFIFGLRYIVEAATDQLKTRRARAAGKLARWALYTARGPMFALNILAVAVCCVYAVLVAVNSPRSPVAAVWAASLLVLLSGFFFAWVVKEKQWSKDTWIWMVISSITSLAAVALLQDKLSQQLDPYIYLITSAMTVGAIVMSLLGLLSLAFAAVARPLRTRGHRSVAGPLSVIVFCTSLSLGLFVFAVIGVWTLVIKALSESHEARTNRCLTATVAFRECMTTTSTVPTAQLAERIETGVHLLPLVVLAFFALALLFLGVVMANQWRLKKGKPILRYIVNRMVLLGYVLVTAVYGLAFLPLAYILLKSGGCAFWLVDREALICEPTKWDHAPALLARWIESLPDFDFIVRAVSSIYAADTALKALALAATTIVITFVVSQRVHFLTALDLILDVIAHFRTTSTPDFVVWKQIVNRFKLVVEDTIRETKADRIVIVSHSQGTAIAAHGLGVLLIEGCAVVPVGLNGVKVRMITMGSPIKHLYKYYMPDRYSIQKPHAVTHWLNIHRIDDFIGMSIDSTEKNYPKNIAIGRGGHSNYWGDLQFIRRLLRLL